ncbi:MAG TPA: GNAT family N-acetyltransferase, partial [Candidatus Lustribacter sp.]|nr:GNAT family N-acetyltransferase [Candidatus Lustribacter sp.]
VDPLDPRDERLVLGCIKVYNRANSRVNGPHAQQVNLDQIRSVARDPAERRRAWAALDEDGKVVGAVTLIEPLRENLDTASVWLAIRPRRWREGIGRLLQEQAESAAHASGRHRLYDHQESSDPSGGPGAAFARAMGHRESRLDLALELELPVPGRLLKAWEHEVRHPAYEILTAWDTLPQDWLEDRARLARRLSTDAPLGIDLDEGDWDADRLRTQWARGREQGTRAVESVARERATGRLVAYSDVSVALGNPDLAIQLDTLVLREHRGHRLGMAVKVANLRALAHELPGLARIRTWNAESNTPMLAVNQAMGFEVVGWTREWVKDL